MNATQALARLRKAIGPKILWRENPGAPNAAEREAARIQARELRDQQETLQVALQARRDELLRDPEYVHLREQFNDVRQRADLASAASHRRRLSVGRMGDMFFNVMVEGDNWEDVIARAKEKGILK